MVILKSLKSLTNRKGFSMCKVDNVNHPSHYEGNTSLECIECMVLAMGKEAVYNFCLCNAFKYLWRYKNKNGEEDIKKANWYLNYVGCAIEKCSIDISEDICKMYYRLNDLYIDITDRIANNVD